MFETIGFLVSLALTVVALLVTVVSGLRKQRHAHLRRAIVTVLLMAVTIVFAFLLGDVREFPAEEMAIHKIFSRTGAYMVPPVAITGAMLWRRPGWRWPHRLCIGVFLVGVLGAAVTGVWILALSTPLP